ncbi:putative extracellular serine-rich protein [Golovinomyces cichoracearum]|uniref:Putative extracellular serine-rich protein n=1 Tax=Golovinomyces cichoracearum TaxID=62708 RepID=A0A420IWX9_9PEZI|nr:putative extracellular serine-rich protein [Golovinomyces cichoracearum]
MQILFLLLSALNLGSVIAQKTPASTNTSGASDTSSSDPKDGAGQKGANDQIKVHVVRVGANNKTIFEPNKLTANVGEMIQFQFFGGNHTVTQSSFEQPCTPISLVNASIKGFYSGFMPVSASKDNLPTYSVMVENMTPIWIYCAQGQHCQKGMNMVINENLKANASRSLENFSKLAAQSVTVQMKTNKDPTKLASPSKPLPSSGSAQIISPSGTPSKPGSSKDKGDKDSKDDKDGKDSKDGNAPVATPANPPKPDNPVAASGVRVGTSSAISILVIFLYLVL